MGKIDLTIQEILRDFEKMVRHDEHLNAYFDHKWATDDDIEKFHDSMVEMAEKYLPTYWEHMPAGYFSDELSDYEIALEIYKMLYENFKEIIFQLV